MMADFWWRFRCMAGWHDWFHFNRGRICESCGKTVKFKSACVVPNKPDHRFYTEDLQQLLLEGMDPVWFEECLRDVGIICIPYHSGETPRKGLTDEVLRCIKEFGDVGAAIRKAMDAKSRGGRRITNNENNTIQREIDEAIEELQQLSKAVNQAVC